MVLQLLIAFAAILVCSCASVPVSPRDALENAYRNNSVSHLEEFLDSWHLTGPAAEKGDATPAFEAALAIFKDVYRPRELQRLGRPEWEAHQYSEAEYAIVQETLRYQIVSDASFPGRMTNQDDLAGSVDARFCPRLDIPDMKRLCLDEAFRNLLHEFLGDESVPALEGSIMAPARAKGESKKRLEFLNDRLKIFEGHWGGWYLETHPRISLIRFNESFTKAIVYFQVVHQGGEAHYNLTEEGWMFQKAQFTWIT